MESQRLACGTLLYATGLNGSSCYDLGKEGLRCQRGTEAGMFLSVLKFYFTALGTLPAEKSMAEEPPGMSSGSKGMLG